MVAIGRKWYFLNNDLTVNLNNYIDFAPCNCDMTFGGIYFKLIYPYLLYTINDSIYIDNFENKERLFITDHGYPYF